MSWCWVTLTAEIRCQGEGGTNYQHLNQHFLLLRKYVGPMREIPRSNIFCKMPHRSKPLCNMSWQSSIGLQIMTSLPRRRDSVYFNYDNRPPTVSSGERTSSLSLWFTIHFANQGHWLTYWILSGVYRQPIKGGYHLVSCQSWTSNSTLNMGEGQPYGGTDRWCECGCFSEYKLETGGGRPLHSLSHKTG